jgi:neutral ceramidase
MASVPFVADQPYKDDPAQAHDDLNDDAEKPLLGGGRHRRSSSAATNTDLGWTADSQGTRRRSLRRLALLLLVAVPIIYLSSNASVVDSVSGWTQKAAGKCGMSSWIESWSPAPVEPLASRADEGYVFGVGIGDITGPIVETNMMGYAADSQTNTGLHTRLRARAFIVGSQSSVPPTNPPAVNAPKDPEYSPGGEEDPVDGLADRWILLNTDLCMGDTAIRRGLIAKLRDAFPGVYGERNIAFIGTHSHAGVAGFHNNLLPTVTSYGVVQQNYDAIVEGSFKAVQRAHEDYEERRQRTVSASSSDASNANKISFGNATLREAHTNRSPYAYDFNPAEWKDKYDSNQDDSFSLIKFEESGASKAFASFYAVHGTALSANNTLTSVDNKGLAALWYEQEAEPDSLPGQNSFIAGFIQASVGDTSPNTLGARCEDGSPCDYETSTCIGSNGKNTTSTCIGRGPGFGDEAARELSPTGGYDWRSNEIIARLQVDAAKGIMDRTDLLSLSGTVKSAKMNVDMNSYTFTLPNRTSVTTCPAALGFSFGGGTTDYPGPKGLGLEQGTNSSDHTNPLLTVVSHLIRPPSPATTKCHLPKKILLATGQLDLPYQWSPHVVETQILKVGSLFILVTPSEFTTMAGRLLKEAVRDAVIAQGIDSDPITVIAGPANTYSHYVTSELPHSP